MEDKSLARLNTEQQNPDTVDIDSCSTEEVLIKINNEDQKVAEVVRKQIPAITGLVEVSYEAVKNGGRIIYIGAGTSGRLGILDASECPPTYGVSPDLVQGIIAGGEKAIFTAQEGAEDSFDQCIEDLKKRNLNSKDIVIGLAASGRTPYVIGALKYANSIGAMTGSICCVENAEISKYAKFPVEVVTGPEVVTGSTRMKAGTAEKMVLNMISTTTMIKMGKVFHNYMVDVQPTNIKLEKRACSMIKTILEIDDEEAQKLFIESGKNVKTAIIMSIMNMDKANAQKVLEKADGHISKTIRESL
ncbi:N-acetylmuramic acid 6-phosphate etherase [Erysipelotrichaceae bacterium HCN-30851]